jgi:hypothetical protein
MKKIKKQLLAQKSDSSIKLKPEDVIRNIVYSLSNQYRLKYLTDWEKNHSTEKAPYDKKADKLEKLRDKLIKTIKENPEAEIEITIDIKIN